MSTTTEVEDRRRALLELRRALLPAALPVLPAVELDAQFPAADEEAPVGAWFDAVPLPDGRVALAVGEVLADGVVASAVVAGARALLAEALADTGDLVATAHRLDRFAARDPASRATTMCLASLQPETGTLQYLVCGHGAPSVVSVEGGARLLAGTSRGSPLGAGTRASVRNDCLEPGEVLRLCSDSAGDGATLTARRRRTPTLTLELRGRAEFGEVQTLRAEFDEWLGSLGAVHRDVQAVRLAVNELTANAVEHAYAPGVAGELYLRAHLGRDGLLRVEVADGGNWQPPAAPAPTSGRGLWLAEEMVDELKLDRGTDGTVVRLAHRMLRPVTVVADRVAPSRKPTSEARFVLGESAGVPCVRAEGIIDVSTARRFRDQVMAQSRGGLHPVILDLAAVRMLGGAGVRVLFELRRRLAVHGHELVLHADRASPIAVLLETVGLHHRPPPTTSVRPEGRHERG